MVKDNPKYDKTEFMLGNVRREDLLPNPHPATGYTIGDGYDVCPQCEFCGRQLPHKSDSMFETPEYPCWTWKSIVIWCTTCDYFQENSRDVINRITRKR